jgi:hypothetical protein
MVLQKFQDRKTPPARFLTDADEEKHEKERLKKPKRLWPEWRVEPRANKHRDTEAATATRTGSPSAKEYQPV